MDKIQIYGGNPLSGTIMIGGSKNASLPVMCASLLTDEPLILGNVPHLADITTMANLLSQHGVEVSLEGHDDNEGHIGRVLSLKAKDINNTTNLNKYKLSKIIYKIRYRRLYISYLLK